MLAPKPLSQYTFKLKARMTAKPRSEATTKTRTPVSPQILNLTLYGILRNQWQYEVAAIPKVANSQYLQSQVQAPTLRDIIPS